MNKKFFSGDSVHQALLQAARHFQVEPELVAYREVDRRHGFLRGRRRAVIEVDLDRPVREQGEVVQEKVAAVAVSSKSPTESIESLEKSSESLADESESVEPTSEEAVRDWSSDAAWELPGEEIADVGANEKAEPANEAAPDTAVSEAAPVSAKGEPVASESEKPAVEGGPALEVAARQALERLFEVGRLDLEVRSVGMGEEKLEVELRGKDEEFLLEDRGRLLLAMQHLLPRMLRGLTGRSAPCLIDCDDFHEIRTEQLRDLAQRVASEVRNSRRSRTMEPMSPDERRIVHLTLADDPAVETVSQGNGLFKRVQVRPQRIERRDFDPFGRELDG